MPSETLLSRSVSAFIFRKVEDQGRSTRHGALASAVAVGAALIAAVVVGGLVRWSSSAAHQDSNDDPRFRFQGHVARVVEAIAGDRPGRITFEVDSRHYDLRATAIDGGQVAAGTEVVIEHIADDLATVDLWSRIEDRL